MGEKSSFELSNEVEKAIKKLGIKRDLTREERDKIAVQLKELHSIYVRSLG